jgi:hypothetical protein
MAVLGSKVRMPGVSSKGPNQCRHAGYLGVGHWGIAAPGGGGAELGAGAAGCSVEAGFNRATTRGFFGVGFLATGGGGGVGCSSTNIGLGVR